MDSDILRVNGTLRAYIEGSKKCSECLLHLPIIFSKFYEKNTIYITIKLKATELLWLPKEAVKTNSIEKSRIKIYFYPK
jgi:hypothetical protein